jgi:glycosyltransferase involved in cell wall biosynthesis
MSSHFVTSSDQVVILMCTYNGAEFLSGQLDSIAAQTYTNWRLVVSDDGSSDDTVLILQAYQRQWGVDKLEIRFGPRQGFCQNFLSISCDPTITGSFFAFCDQDDVWLKHKLTVAVMYLSTKPDLTCPYLYCGRTIYVQENLKIYGYSSNFDFPKTFRNALVQSIAGGNTMVFNSAAKRLLEIWGPQPVQSHDWWLYLLVTGVGGQVYFDPNPHLLYRQHRNSLVGDNNSIKAKLIRIRLLFQGRFYQWNCKNINALFKNNSHLSNSNYKTLYLFRILRDGSLLDRIRLIRSCGLYRQTQLGTIGLYLAIILNRV